MATLPARVRLTVPPLPLAPALVRSLNKLCPQVQHPERVVMAIAGGAVIGVGVRSAGQHCIGIETHWKGHGVEEALNEELARLDKEKA